MSTAGILVQHRLRIVCNKLDPTRRGVRRLTFAAADDSPVSAVGRLGAALSWSHY
jgi:hypothetical protein